MILQLLLKFKRLFDITPLDVKGDDTILIDIDDTNRFLKKSQLVLESKIYAQQLVI